MATGDPSASTYAYTLFACDWNAAARQVIGGWSLGGLIELLVSGEESADVADYGAYERGSLDSWEWSARRNTVVQLTRGWDGSWELARFFFEWGVPLLFEKPTDRPDVTGRGTVLVFPVEARLLVPLEREAKAADGDRRRFWQVVRVTAELAASRNWSLLFVGTHGFDYDLDGLTPTRRRLIKDAGFVTLDRHA